MRLWDGVSTQWRTSGFGVVGLDYPAVREVATMLMPPVEYTPRVFAKIRALEREELKRLAERREATGTEAGI